MSSYIIAGSADNPETGLCEHIANEIKSYYQNIDFRIIIKHPKEWDNFIHEILRIYGFKKMYDPIVYTLDGKLIGGLEGFRNLAENGFGIDTKNLTIEIVPEINMKIVEKEVAQKKKIQKGKKTLEEKIALSLKTKLQDGDITCIEGYYKPFINSGMLFYVKQESKLCPEIFIPSEQRLAVVEEKLEAEKLNIDLIRQNDIFTQETQPAEEELKDDSKIIQENSKQEINQSELDQSKEQNIEQQGTDEVNQTAEDQKGENQGEGAEGQVEGEEGQLNQSLEGQTQQLEGQQQTQQQILLQEDEPEEDDLIQEVQQDNNSNLVDLNKFLIKKFKDEYHLAFHPEPLLDGQIILFEKVEKQVEEQKDCEILVEEQDQEEEQLDFVKGPEEDTGIYISDWSSGVKHRKLKKSKKKKQQQQSEGQAALQSSRTQKDAQSSQPELNQQQSEQEKLQKSKFQSKLNRDIVELDKPLSKNDWKKIKKLLKKLDCAVTLQILPFGHKNHLPLSNNVLNVYLREFLIRANQNKGIIEVVEDYNKNEQELDVKLLPFEKYILDLQGQAGKVKTIQENFIQIPNLDFDHLIYMCQDPKKRKAKLMKQRFKEMINILYSEEDLMKYGINLIVTSQFFMLVPLRGSYGEFEGKPLYLNPISYLGYIHVPIMTKIWPNTAYKLNSLSDDNNYIQMLNNQISKQE